MISLWNKLTLSGIGIVAGAAIAACTVTSTTTGGGTDGGTSSGDSGSGSDAAAAKDTGTIDTDSGSGGSCKATDVQFQVAACDSCVHSKCATELAACFQDTSAAGCACQALDDCLQACAPGAGEAACVQACVAGNAAGKTAESAWLNCVDSKCGPADAGGNGTCM